MIIALETYSLKLYYFISISRQYTGLPQAESHYPHTHSLFVHFNYETTLPNVIVFLRFCGVYSYGQ